MTPDEFAALIRSGMAAIEQQNTLLGLLHFEEASRHHPTPTVLSCLGYCLASEKGLFAKARALCQEAVQQEPANSLHYLNLGRVYLLARRKDLALLAFRKGLKFGRQPAIVREMRKLGLRRPPVFAGLGRGHRLNRYCGFVFSRLGVR
ncbi:MAG: tetratricopeptide repeat protein [Desulfuromonadales bacterium]|jgi:Flp pilus assembly protein TadD